MTRALAVLAGSLVLALTAVSATSAQTTPAAPATVVPTFTKDVAPILFKHCASCHRPGEIGPMSFMSYETARPWARAIQQKVVSREMPPWGADAAHSMKMRNDRSLSQAEIDTIVAWVKAGGPRGEPTDMPPAPTFATGWQLGEPDYIFEMPIEWTIKAEGAEAYLYFYQPIPFTEDKMARAIEIRPSNFKTVHHSGAYVPDHALERAGHLALGVEHALGRRIARVDPLARNAVVLRRIPRHERLPDVVVGEVPVLVVRRVKVGEVELAQRPDDLDRVRPHREPAAGEQVRDAQRERRP